MNSLRQLALDLVEGRLSESAFRELLDRFDCTTLDGATLDADRARRCGYPEVVYAAGKPLTTLLEIVQRLQLSGEPILVTRVDAIQAEALLQVVPDLTHNELARTCRSVRHRESARTASGKVTVVSAGTSDLSVAEEVCETLAWMDVSFTRIVDVGVAGPQRLRIHVPVLRDSAAVVVVAGMEGALPSVVGGYVSCPVFAVPTSIGYGANFGGVAALLAMLNSCAANVAVCNIDAGFKGGYLAGLVARRNLAITEPVNRDS